MTPKQTSAVVINVIDYGESDKIITCYCPERGKLSGIAKGAKRSKKRFVNKLELFSLLNMQYTETRNHSLVRIDNAELITSFTSLRQHYNKYTAAVLLCELITHWTHENDGDKKLFNLLIDALHNLNNDKPIAGTLILFQIKLLNLAGFRPDLAGCLNCGSLDAAHSPYRFNSHKSGLVCDKCNKNNRSTARDDSISINTAKLLLKAQDMDHRKMSRLRFSHPSSKEALSMLNAYGNHLLQREIQSFKYLVLN